MYTTVSFFTGRQTQLIAPMHVREPTAGLPVAASRPDTAGSTPHHRPPGLGPPRHQPCPPNHPSFPSPLSAVFAVWLLCSSWTLTSSDALSASRSRRRQGESCSCHMRTVCKCVHAGKCGGRKNARRGGCVRNDCAQQRTTRRKSDRADLDAVLALSLRTDLRLLAPARGRAYGQYVPKLRRTGPGRARR